MAESISEKVVEFLSPVAKSLGLEIVEVDYSKKYNGMNLTITIYKTGGVNIEDCERFHRAVDEPLDELNPTNDKPYTLNVSSMGLDRPLKTMNDYLRLKGEEIELKLYAQVNGKKEYTGKLNDFSDGTVYIDTADNGILFFKHSDIAKAVRKITF